MMMHIPYNALKLLNEPKAKTTEIKEPEKVTDAVVVAKGPGVIGYNHLLSLFNQCGNLAPETFDRNNPGKITSWNYGAALYFLRITYVDSMQTVYSYSRFLCKYSEYLATTNLHRFCDVVAEDVTNYRAWLISKGLKPNTINTYMAILKSFYIFIVEAEGYDTPSEEDGPRRNPMYALKRRIQADAQKSQKIAKGKISGHTAKVLTRQQIEDLLERVRKVGTPKAKRDYALLEFLYMTGARCIEAIRLTWGDIYNYGDKKRWYVHLQGKGSKDREVYLPYLLIQDLMAIRLDLYKVPSMENAPGLDDVPVFTKIFDKYAPLKYRTVHEFVQKWGEDAALQLGVDRSHKDKRKKTLAPHWMRHTFATHARAAGYSEKQLQYTLGHENPATTGKYGTAEYKDHPIGEMFEKPLG